MPLSVRFTPYDGACGESFTAKVLRVLDYGDERFAECSVTEKVPLVKVYSLGKTFGLCKISQ